MNDEFENQLKEPAPKYNYISPEEYLAMERESEEKHEYYDGFVIAMSGVRLKHNQIETNLIAKLDKHLEKRGCQILPSNIRVSTPTRDSYMYPDATIVCGEPKLEDDKFDTLVNPLVIFEIWSPSTQHNDVGYKLFHYKNIPSLAEYIMIDSSKRFVQTVRKERNGAWRFEDVTDPTSFFRIETIGFDFSIEDLYRNTSI